MRRRDVLPALAGLAALPLLPALGRVPAAGTDAAEAAYPSYQPARQVSGRLRTWGHGSRNASYAGGLVAAWEAGFRQYHPGVSFQTILRGTSTGIGGLYTEAADFALMTRDPIGIELDAYLPIFKHPPFAVQVATGSLAGANRNPAMAAFVHPSNPLARMTLADLDAVLGADHRRGPRNIRRWGELGLEGEWRERPIALYIPEIAGEDAQYLERSVMQGSQKWNGDLREFPQQAGSQPILDALAADRWGLAVAAMPPQPRGVKPLALSATPQLAYVQPTVASVADRSYPLTRHLQMMLVRAPGQPLPSLQAEYLRYILSAQGQAAVARDGQYLPLPPALASQQWSTV